MADKASDGLPYGQLGRSIYDPEDREWAFSRSKTSQLLLKPIGASKEIATSAAKTFERRSGNSSKDAPSRRREKQTAALIQSLPELQSASHILPELARVSEAIEDAVSQHDCNTDQLLSVGKVYDESKRDYVSAIAFPSGATGSDLRIVEGLKQRQGCDEERSSWIEALDFTGEEGTWKGPGVPILSVTFAQPLERGERYLAVRLQTEILVFRPTLRKEAGLHPSRLDPNILFSIGITETGGSPHVPVAFNPWFTGQIGIVDHSGSWSIWETGRKSNTARRIKSGALTGETKAKGKKLLDDGWLRIVWVESASSICVATRRKLVLFDLEAAEELGPTTVDLGSKRALNWALDVATVADFPSILFVLTSNHIQIYRIEKDSSGQLVTNIMLQIRHHRSPEDGSLRMRLLTIDNVVILILSSALNPTVNQFKFDLADTNNIQIQLPGEFDLPPGSKAQNALDYQLEPVRMLGSDADLNDPSAFRSFCHLYLLGKDMALSQTLYTVETSRRSDDLVEAPTWVTEVSKAKKKSSQALAGFAFDEDAEGLLCKRPTSDYVQRRQRQTLSRSGQDWTVSCDRMAQRLNEHDIEERVDIEEVIEEISTLLRGPPSQANQPMRSLCEVAGGTVDVEDFEGASARLEGLRLIQPDERTIKTEVEEQEQKDLTKTLKVVTLAPPAAQKLLDLQGLDTLADALNTVRRVWAAPNSEALPQPTIATRDENVKRVAAEVTLAARLLRFEETQQDELLNSQSQGQLWDLPVRQSQAERISQDATASDYNASSRAQTPALPTPSASASTITASSHPSSFAAPEVARLSKYSTFSKDPPPSLARALNKVLSHWTIGADPAEYDWRSTARQVSRGDEKADGDEMTEKERNQMRRRTERYIRRQRREAEESQRQQVLSSQAPEIMSASQPAQRQGLSRAESQVSAGAAAGSSQSYGLSQMVASQVVPGRHGGRAPPRKKRKSGF